MKMRHTPFKEYVRTLHHKKAVRAIATVTIIMGLPFIGAYSCLLATKRIKLEKIKLPLANPLSNLKGLKIAQISDLHYGPTNKSRSYFNRAIDKINTANPDLIVLTGDYYQWDPNYLHGLPKLLGRLRAPLGVYGSLGNHDYGSCYPGSLQNDPFEYDIVKSAFERHNITILTNEHKQLCYNDQKFNLVGLHDLWSGMFDPEATFSGMDNEYPTIILSHNPDTAPLVKDEYDLMLSGHSHGGQVSWPLFGPITTPVAKRKHRRGLHQVSPRKRLYVNRGLGYTFKMRLNSPPEVTLIEIV